MDVEQIIIKPSKYDRANFFSKMFCIWLYPVFIKGLKSDVELNDLYKCSVTDECEELALKLDKNWNAELKKKSPSLTRITIKTFMPKLIFPFCCTLFGECFIQNIKPVLLGLVIRYFADPKTHDYRNACLYAAGVVGSTLLYLIAMYPPRVLELKVAIKTRVSLCALMYKKSLRLNQSAFRETTVGQILNLMSNDVSRFDDFSGICHYIIVAPIQSIIGIYICWLYLGWVCLIALAILLCYIPFNALMGRLFMKIREKTAALTDNRLRLMNEIIKGMRVIKMYAWEKHFAKLVSEARKKEMFQIRNSSILRVLNFSISCIYARVILFTILIVYVLLGGHLEAEVVFVTMSILNNLQLAMTLFFPASITRAAEIYVSLKRIQKFLLLDEFKQKEIKYFDKNNTNNANHLNVTDDSNSDYNVIVDDMSAKWDLNQDIPTLHNISVNVRPGELLAIVGPVGSGKSSFLMSVLNEMAITSGSVRVNGSIAYVSQESWAFNSSVLENIRFGKAYDSSRLAEVIGVCAMNRDLKAFPFGDKTLVGERGVTLSGGQKARLSLARALYNNADIYLLDDPLSAVDSDVAKHIFEKCITEYLSTKTVVLVTHQIQFLRKATKILVLKDGRPLALGSYEELENSGIDFMSLIEEKKCENERTDLETKSEELFIGEEVIQTKRRTSTLSADSETEIEVNEQMLNEETKPSGAIKAKVYWAYIRAGGGPILIMIAVLATVIHQALFNYCDIWLSEWTNREDERNASNNATLDQKQNIYMYSILVASVFIALTVRAATFFMICVIASVNLHNRIFYRLMRAPIDFFDTNPMGRILNRFTRDIGVIDEQMPLTAFDAYMILIGIIGNLIIVAIVNYYLTIPAILIIILILIIRSVYIKTARDLKRYENMVRSPLYNHTTTTLSGLATIRAFRAQELFQRQYYRYQDDHTGVYFMSSCSAIAFGVLMDWICIIYIFAITLLLMIFHAGLPSGSAGLALTMALGLTGKTQWGVRQSTIVENQMTSVERIVEYSSIESEAQLESVCKPALDWPQNGRIELRDVSLTYSNHSKPTLIGLNCEIRAGEKVGVVGRTGAGKSSLLAALFRMREINGNILIDDIDSKAIGLHDLRRKISVIPQEPMAFIGSLRQNLDPFEEHSEAELWQALEAVRLREAVEDMSAGLEHQLSESGGNLSVGQRQLICLSRAILRRNRILVLDEATANVDHKTDALIQTALRHNFADCTVLTIAHRLNTIVDSDRVLVLDEGRIQEFDQPYLLLQNPYSYFSKLVKQTGTAMATDLFRAAKQAFDARNQIPNNS